MLQLMAWDQIYQITHILSKIAVVIMYIYMMRRMMIPQTPDAK